MRYLSVCSGIEAASVAWAPLGFSPVAFAEVEPFPCAVLARHYPDVPNLGDMTMIDGSSLRGRVHVLVGGTPCQSFSVAGLRRGLDDERGNLALEFARLADECNPAFIVWENVPGVLSDRGNAFGCLLAALAGENAPLLPPGGRWTDSGYVLGPGRTIAWRILDAQYFGLAQRRRRVFLVACPCGGADPRKVLFEFGGLRRDTPPSREKGQDITQALARSLGTGGPDDNRAQGGFYVPQIVEQAMSCKWAKGTSGPAGDEHHNLIAGPLNCRPYADNVAQESRLALAVRTAQTSANGCGVAAGLSHTLDGANGQAILSFHGSQDPDVSKDVTHPLGRNQGRETCIAIQAGAVRENPQSGPQGRGYRGDGLAYTLEARAEVQALAVQQNQSGDIRQSDVAYTLGTNTSPSGRNTPMIQTELRVRRLTPLECERLQGFPDHYTRIAWRGKSAENCPDAPRYKALGNSMAVPVMRWLGKRILMADKLMAASVEV